MTETRTLQVDPAHLALVRAILVRHIPDGIAVWAFGSRATGKAKPFSDLDLALESAAPLPQGLIGDLVQAFEESDLPWKVDVADWSDLSPAIRDHIGDDRIRL